MPGLYEHEARVKVTVLNTKTGAILAKIQTGASPHGLCYFPQPGNISLGHNGVYR